MAVRFQNGKAVPTQVSIQPFIDASNRAYYYLEQMSLQAAQAYMSVAVHDELVNAEKAIVKSVTLAKAGR